MSIERPLGVQSTPPSVSKTKTADVVLYVDLDGVIQHEQVLYQRRRGFYPCPVLAPGRRLFEWVHLLVEALEPYPDLRCVLSSSWCIWPGYERTLKMLPAELSTRFVGGTFHTRVHGVDFWSRATFKQSPRWLQIWEDVKRRKPKVWLALDDDCADWPTWCINNLVACDGETGLSSPSVQRALADKLSRAYAWRSSDRFRS